MYADISVVAYAGTDNRRFSYKYSQDMAIAVGSIVKVKFGKNISLGIVRELKVKKPQAKIKVHAIESVLAHNTLPIQLLSLADWIVEYYVAPASTVWQLLLPKNPHLPHEKYSIPRHIKRKHWLNSALSKEQL